MCTSTTINWAHHYPPASEARVEILTEAELAGLRREQGARVVEHCGRYWQETLPGFYEPIPPLARLRAQEVTRPTWRCWGCRAILAEEDVLQANAAMPVHVMSDVQSFGEWRLDRRKRENLRSALKQLTFLTLTDSLLLESQGYEVYSSQVCRLGLRHGLKEADYLSLVRSWTRDSRQLVIAGLRDNKLCGYMVSYVVGDTGYLAKLHVATDALDSNVAVGLYFHSLSAMIREGIGVVHCGSVLPESPGLVAFKRHLGFTVVALPSRFVVPPLVEPLMKLLRPYAYYRFTGRTTWRMKRNSAELPRELRD